MSAYLVSADPRFGVALTGHYETKRPVRTASVTQVRQPLYRRSLARWKNDETALAHLFSLLPVPEDTDGS